MRKFFFYLGIPALVLTGYVIYLAADAGEFRQVTDLHPGVCQQIAGVPGPEDITLYPNRDLALISSFDRRAAANGRPVPGAIFAWTPGGLPVNLTPDARDEFRPHGISLYVGPDGRATLYVINHPAESLFGTQPEARAGLPAHAVEVFDVIVDAASANNSDGIRLVHRATYTNASMVSPNDIVGVDHERFYFTNDHGSTPGWKRALEDYLRLGWANVVYFDGAVYREVADGLSYANGINLSPDGARLYVAEVTHGRIRDYRRDAATGALDELRRFDAGFGVDNIEVDPDSGELWLGGHVKLLTFARYADDPRVLAPSQAARVRFGGAPAVETVFLDDGGMVSGASVAAARDGLLLVGSVFDPHFVVCRQAR